MDCLFCKIIKKEIPAQLIFEDKDIIAFRDIAPQATVHILIIPKKHIPGLNDISALDEAVLGRIQFIAKELAIKEKISEDGYRLVLNTGRNGGQAVAHLHYHLLGGRKFTWPPG
jgi:histidine triad (HIT) family protein